MAGHLSFNLDKILSLEKEFNKLHGPENPNWVPDSYYKEYKEIVDASDVIIEVLDARDPLGSRCLEVEHSIINSTAGKQLIILLNKIDLVPYKNVEQWLKYLRREIPAVPFKSSNYGMARDWETVDVARTENPFQSSCIGADILVKGLHEYCRNQNIQTPIRIGVVGFPNVGKRSVIKSLKLHCIPHVDVAPRATEALQEIALDEYLILLDSPGIAYSKEEYPQCYCLEDGIKSRNIKDPVAFVDAIIKRADHHNIFSHYGVYEYVNAESFIDRIAKKHSYYLPKTYIDSVARIVISEMAGDRISYYADAPKVIDSLSGHSEAKVFQEMKKIFEVDAWDEKKMFEKAYEDEPNR